MLADLWIQQQFGALISVEWQWVHGLFQRGKEKIHCKNAESKSLVFGLG